MHSTRLPTVIFLIIAVQALAACSGYKQSRGDWRTIEEQSAGAVQQFLERDPTLQPFMDGAHAYAVFPKISKGALGIGAAHGRGVVYEGGIVVGYSSLSQVTIGSQIGGKTYRELIFFEAPVFFEKFKKGDVQFAAQASAVAASKGGAAETDFDEGVAVFTLGHSGLMLEAAIGGQKFAFRPKHAAATSSHPLTTYEQRRHAARALLNRTGGSLAAR